MVFKAALATSLVTQADRPTVVGTDTDHKPLPQVDLRRLLQVGTEAPDR